MIIMNENKKVNVSLDTNEIHTIILSLKDYSKFASMVGDGQTEHECYDLIKKLGGKL